MKKLLIAAAVALAITASVTREASAWVNFKFGVGLNADYASGDNNMGWGLFRNGQIPGYPSTLPMYHYKGVTSNVYPPVPMPTQVIPAPIPFPVPTPPPPHGHFPSGSTTPPVRDVNPATYQYRSYQAQGYQTQGYYQTPSQYAPYGYGR